MSLSLGQYRQYVPLAPNEKYARLNELRALFNEYAQSSDCRGVVFRKEVLLDIIERVEKRKVYYRIFHGKVMSEQNEAALYCFWILKLAPFFDGHAPNRYINVLFAAFLFLRVADRVGRRMSRRVKVSGKYVQNLFYAFLYRDISKEAIMGLAESLLE